ncbi:MAG: hypothetical protein IJH07_00500 [Ruminococcus sp.]|nr:hypothetical protein [Ruminococcus sp.]
MKVQIINIPQNLHLIPRQHEPFDAYGVSKDPDSRYAVIEASQNSLFIAVKVVSCDNDLLVGEYVDHYRFDNDIPMMMKYTVLWDCIRYGFCKLNLWAPEMADEFSGYFDQTVKRFYFDWELYKKCYEDINGVPCKKQDPNKRRRKPS